MESLILFRGIRKDTSEMIEGQNIFCLYENGCDEKQYAIIPSGSRYKHIGEGNILIKPYVIDKDTLGQFTGEYDIERNKIFSRDVVEFYDDNDQLRIGMVVFEDGLFGIKAVINNEMWVSTFLEVRQVKVIGTSFYTPKYVKKEHSTMWGIRG